MFAQICTMIANSHTYYGSLIYKCSILGDQGHIDGEHGRYMTSIQTNQ